MDPREEVKAAYKKIGEAEDVFHEACEKHKGNVLSIYDELHEMRSRRGKYPLEVTAIRTKGFMEPNPMKLGRYKAGAFVAIRPCADECKDKTYLGIYMDDLPVGVFSHYEEVSGVFTIHPRHNPAIWVPALSRIVYGCESWWGPIKSPEDAEKMEISDDDIQNIWYVKALKEQFAKAEEEALNG